MSTVENDSQTENGSSDGQQPVVTERICCFECSQTFGIQNQYHSSSCGSLRGQGGDSNCSFCGEPNGGRWIGVFTVETPDYRNNGKYQFVRGISHFGAHECIHLTREQIERQLTEKAGEGTLVDTGKLLYWVPSQ